MKNIILNFGLSIVSLAFCLLLAEILFRVLIFNDNLDIDRFRFGGAYADGYSEDDFWKLQYRFGGPSIRESNKDALLGWEFMTTGSNYIHRDYENLHERRPVLLYGDSFAGCTGGVNCFQTLFNQNDSLNKDYYFLNYGNGGYGLDQICLLFEASIANYDNPFVIFSFMTLDLDRSVLSFRSGAKPMFTISEEGEIDVHNQPVELDYERLYENNPVEINSYLWRYLIFSDFFPNKLQIAILDLESRTEYKKLLNTAILERVVQRLDSMNLDYVILVFHPNNPDQDSYLLKSQNSWRDNLLLDFFNQHETDYVWSKDIIMKHHAIYNTSIEDYIIPKDGHPTTLYNELVLQEVVSFISKSKR